MVGLSELFRFRSSLTALVVLLAASAACSTRPAETRTYPIRGQVLAVLPDRQSLTLAHEDIPDLMPAMTMTYRVASPDLLKDRTVGELVSGTLEMTDAGGQLTALTHTGSAPVPENANQIAMATGILGVGDEIPDAALVDERNERQAVSDWKGRVTLLTFIYTRCPLPNYCPLMDANFSSLQAAILADPSLRRHVHLVSVSFDPAHDTPEVLAAHAKAKHADPSVWTFLTGDVRTIDRFAGKMGVSVVPENDSTITHTLRTVLVGPDNRIRQIYTGNEWTPEAVLADLRTAASAL